MTAALLWVACDHLRTFLLGGFPWALLGYAQHENGLLLRLAPYTGVLGLSFVTALGGGALASLTTARPGARRRSRAGGLAIVAILALHGVLAAVPRPGPEGTRRTVRVAALQGNIDQSAKWSRERFLETVAIYEDLSVRAAAEGAEIVVWPETAIAGPLGLIPDLGQRLSELASRIGASLVVGAVGVEVDPSHGEITHYYDSAFAYHADGSFAGRYDKSHLVPFGEYVPLRSLLGGLLAAAARGVAPMDVTAGAAPASMDLNLAADSAEPGSGPQGQRVKVGIPICYELLFPDLVRHFVADGAGVLLAITNDAWYGRTGAPYQFLVMTAMRSAETGVWTVRAANTGVSAIIDGTGHTRRRTAIFEAGYVIDDIPLLPPEDERSFYVRHGNVFALSCWLALGVVGTIAGLARRENARTPRDESRGRQR
jgi:apolipoprotein N-acyltransferase